MLGGTKAWGAEQEHGKCTEILAASTALGFRNSQSWKYYLCVHCLLLFYCCFFNLCELLVLHM